MKYLASCIVTSSGYDRWVVLERERNIPICSFMRASAEQDARKVADILNREQAASADPIL